MELTAHEERLPPPNVGDPNARARSVDRVLRLELVDDEDVVRRVDVDGLAVLAHQIEGRLPRGTRALVPRVPGAVSRLVIGDDLLDVDLDGDVLAFVELDPAADHASWSAAEGTGGELAHLVLLVRLRLRQRARFEEKRDDERCVAEPEVSDADRERPRIAYLVWRHVITRREDDRRDHGSTTRRFIRPRLARIGRAFDRPLAALVAPGLYAARHPTELSGFRAHARARPR